MLVCVSYVVGKIQCKWFGLKGIGSVKYLFVMGLARADYLPLLCDEALLVGPFLAAETRHSPLIYMYTRGGDICTRVGENGGK